MSESAAKKMQANSVDEIDITLNNNDILINLFGDKGDKESYKCFPDIGEVCNSTILASRRRINDQTLLFDFNSENIKKANLDTDAIFYIAKDSTIYDVEVFCNSELSKVRNKIYYKQIMKYYDMNNEFYQNVINALTPYMNDDEYHPSSDVKYYYKRYSDLINPNTKFKYDSNTFDNIVIRIKTFNTNKLTIGSKITGRSQPWSIAFV
jgi:hypothetical protein